MKKLGLFLIVFVLVATFCFAQSSNDTQRIVGTWLSPGGTTFVFNSDGTFTQDSNSGRYFISSGKLITEVNRIYRIYNIYISSNSRILFLESSGGNWWLDKK
jgi:hypothetical protein